MTMLKIPASFGKTPRKEDPRFLTGKGRYVDDIHLPGETHAHFVRSPYAHAKIIGVDVDAARQAPGVVAVYTGGDLVAAGLGPLICGWMVHSSDGTPMRVGHRPVLAVERVRFVGDPVAVVVARTRNQAKDAAELVMVEYDELPAVINLDHAQQPDAAQLHDIAPRNTAFSWALGDQDAAQQAFARAAHVVTLDFINNRLIPNAMEPRACLAHYEPITGQHTLYLTSQNPHGVRMLMSAVMGLADEHKLRVVSPDVGGGFGSKAFQYPEDIVCLWAAKQLCLPVRWTAERSESFLSDAHGRDHFTHAELALDAEHRFIGLKVKTLANLGGYLSTSGSLVPTYMYATLLSGQYDIPVIYAQVDGVYTNTAPVDAYRGAGRPEAAFVIERMVDVAARRLGVDPTTLRRKNFIRSFPHQTPVVMKYDIGGYEASLDEGLKLIDYRSFAARKQQARQHGKLRGIGFSTYVEACGIGPSRLLGTLGAGAGFWETAEVRVTATGKVEVLAGAHSHGQGHETTYAQVAATLLGVPLDHVSVIEGDTDRVPFGNGTYGSRSSVPLAAVVTATERVIRKACRIAAYLLDTTADDIDFENGLFRARRSNRTLTLPEVSGAAYAGLAFPTTEIEPGLKETCFADPPNFTFPAGCHICEVEIDPETGAVEIVDFVAVDDFGTVINPLIVEGQIHGGVTQGIGQAMLEHAVYDPQSGQLLSGSYMDYCMPRADDVPSYRVGMTVTKSTSNPLGMKGCGEAGAIAAPAAVINALCDALDVAHIDMPATPEKIWRLAQAAARSKEGRDHV